MVIAPPDLKIESFWHEGDGRVPYHWQNFPAGHRCAWTCSWYCHTTEGQRDLKIVTPIDWHMEPENMTSEALLCEIEDIAARGMVLTDVPPARQVLDYLKPSEDGWRYFTIKIISLARQMYPSYLCSWNKPNMHLFEMQPKIRPGWDFPPVEQESFVETVIAPGKGRLLENMMQSRGAPAKRRHGR